MDMPKKTRAGFINKLIRGIPCEVELTGDQVVLCLRVGLGNDASGNLQLRGRCGGEHPHDARLATAGVLLATLLGTGLAAYAISASPHLIRVAATNPPVAGALGLGVLGAGGLCSLAAMATLDYEVLVEIRELPNGGAVLSIAPV